MSEDVRTETEQLRFMYGEMSWLVAAFRKHIPDEQLQAAVAAELIAEGRHPRIAPDGTSRMPAA